MCKSNAYMPFSRRLWSTSIPAWSAAGVAHVADAAASLVGAQQQPRTEKPAAADAAAGSGGSQGGSGPNGGGGRSRSWLGRLAAAVRGEDREAYLVYVLFIAVFVADFSLLTLVYPASLLGYALLSQAPRRQYWEVRLRLMRRRSDHSCHVTSSTVSSAGTPLLAYPASLLGYALLSQAQLRQCWGVRHVQRCRGFVNVAFCRTAKDQGAALCVCVRPGRMHGSFEAKLRSDGSCPHAGTNQMHARLRSPGLRTC